MKALQVICVQLPQQTILVDANAQGIDIEMEGTTEVANSDGTNSSKPIEHSTGAAQVLCNYEYNCDTLWIMIRD